ncbi:MAG: NAD(P)-dependent oxidoreductase, partial [Planctomycetota bacterium]|nr:NAD(P)-dependent oxidoreductase [Planctomycetota bacterium]
EPVAEHALMLMLAVLRRLVIGDREAREAMFRQPSNNPDFELSRKTLGIVGMGRTGFRVAQIARQGFQMEILYHDQVKNEAAEGELGASLVSLDELLERSDIVTLHVNLSAETHHLINSDALKKMGPGSYLINVSRGPVVDEAALVEALRNGEIAGAGLDVYEQEPPAADNPLWDLDQVIVTPHRAGFSRESVYGSSMVVKDIVSVLKGEEPRFPVN